ncbi:MAG: FAD-dependent oxidoreductase [bacterium]|nr:FAD-dependent oxidoreductase [bacterium]
MDKKIAIVGGGIAGLTAAYRLSQKGIKSIVFEKEVLMGGRLQWSSIVAGKLLHPYSLALIKELGLEELIVPLELSDVGAFLPDGNVMKMEDFPKAVESFSPQEMASFLQIKEFFEKNPIDAKNPFPNHPEFREISFAQYMKDCPERLKALLGVELNFRWVKDWNDISAEYGFICMAPLFVAIPLGEMYTFEENLTIITSVLTKKIKEKGSEVLTGSKVVSIKTVENKLKIEFETINGRKEEIVDNLIMAVPLPIIKEIFPEIKIESDIGYVNGKCLLVDGELGEKYNRKALFGLPGNPFNVCLLVSLNPKEHRVYPLDIEKEVRLDKIYNNHRVLGENELISAWPIVPPKGRIPGIKTNIKGVYICGDFYHFPSHDTSVATAEMVVEEIIKGREN